MTENKWCKTNYHKDGKRRFGKLIKGLCAECRKTIPRNIEEEIAELIRQRASLNTQISQLRKKLLPEP